MQSDFTASTMFDGERLPYVLEPAKSGTDLVELAARHNDALDEKLLEHGALLFRGFGVRTIEQFDRAIGVLSKNRADYMYRSTPRTAVGKSIYTATEYPAEREIPLHNENAYQSSWPLRVAFCCITPPASGGETPIADMRRVSATIGQALLESFETRRVRYTRHYHPHFDLPWQEVFQTNDRADVESYCKSNAISYEWIGPSTLRTAHTCQGTAHHPVTNERVFFNQAHLFHRSSLGAEMAELMTEAFGTEQLPRHATYGDGSEISEQDLEVVGDAFRSAAVSFPWQAGDVMILDNMQAAHGRRPFDGDRKIVAALLDPHSDIPLAQALA